MVRRCRAERASPKPWLQNVALHIAFRATLSAKLSMRSLQSQTRSRPMKEMDRRSVITGIVCGAAVATFGLTVIPKAAKSLPLGAIKSGAAKPQDLVEEARVTVH